MIERLDRRALSGRLSYLMVNCNDPAGGRNLLKLEAQLSSLSSSISLTQF